MPRLRSQLALLASLAAGLALPASAQSNALTFDGVDDHALITKWPTLPGQNWTVGLWVRLPAVPTSEQALVSFSKDQGQQRTPWSLRIGSQDPSHDPTRVYVVWDNFKGNGPGYAETAGPTLIPGTWHFLAVSLSSSVALGGELVYQLDDSQTNPPIRYSIPSKLVPVSAIKSNGALLVGADSLIGLGADGAYFQGDIDDLQIWNRALSATEMSSLRNRIPDATLPGLVGLWKFEETGTQTLFDCALPANNGFLGAGSAAGADDPLRNPAGAPVPANIAFLEFSYPAPDPLLGLVPPSISVVPAPGGYVAVMDNAPPNALYALVAAPTSEYLGLEALFAIGQGLVLVPNLGSAQSIQTGFTSPIGQAVNFLPAIPATCSQVYLQFATFSGVPVVSRNDLWLTDAALIQTP